jgi:hypothetical protein
MSRHTAEKEAPGKVVLWWRRFWDRHDDGTKHHWSKIEQTVNAHWCEWDYCRCFWQRCGVCGERRIYSAGSEEVR